MGKALIVYGSTTGDTAIVARKLASMVGNGLADGPKHVRGVELAQLTDSEVLILGTPTWDMGELPDDWKAFYPKLDDLDADGKLVAIFGLGDQMTFPDHFVDAMGILYRKLKERGAQFVGAWPIEGYQFDSSEAVIEGEFVGLALDQQNQWRETEGRLRTWVEQILPSIKDRLDA